MTHSSIATALAVGFGGMLGSGALATLVGWAVQAVGAWAGLA